MFITDIKINEVKVEESKSGKIELIYIPDQTQVLREGRPYRFIFSKEDLGRIKT